MKLNRRLHIPLYIQLKDEILVTIKSDDFAIGDVIPSEQEMMKTYGVGRQTVREAINELVKEGFLEKHQGKGTFIRKKETSMGFEPLMSLSYSLNIRGWKHHNQVLSKVLIDNTSELKRTCQIEGNQLLYLKRARYIDAHPLGLEFFYFHQNFEALIANPNKGNKDGPPFDLCQSIGKFMLETLKLPVERILQEVIIVKASADEAKLLNLGPNSDLMFMKRWLYLKGHGGAYQYYEFKVPVGVSAFPTDLL